MKLSFSSHLNCRHWRWSQSVGVGGCLQNCVMPSMLMLFYEETKEIFFQNFPIPKSYFYTHTHIRMHARTHIYLKHFNLWSVCVCVTNTDHDLAPFLSLIYHFVRMPGKPLCLLKWRQDRTQWNATENRQIKLLSIISQHPILQTATILVL